MKKEKIKGLCFVCLQQHITEKLKKENGMEFKFVNGRCISCQVEEPVFPTIISVVEQLRPYTKHVHLTVQYKTMQLINEKYDNN